MAYLPALGQAAPSVSIAASPDAPGLERIAGTVVNAATGDPVARATVALLAEADSHTVRSVESDNEGHFALEGLPAAKFQLTASKRGFLTAFYDQHEEFNTAIVTGAGREGLDTGSLTFLLAPGAVLRGVITADGGDPVERAQVILFRKPSAHSPGEHIVMAGAADTDDTGAYEFANLVPGDYLLAVKAEPWYALHHLNPQSRQRQASDPSAALDAAYQVTYFDSTVNEAEATTITLAGGSREVANISLHAVPALHIAVETPHGLDSLASSGQPMLRQPIFGEQIFARIFAFSNDPRQKTAEFGGIAPGRYELTQGDPPRIVDLDAASSQLVDPMLGTPTVAVTGTLRISSSSARPSSPPSRSTPSGSASSSPEPSELALPGEVTVTLESLESAHRQTPLTTGCARGAFSFPAVPPGAWNLWAESSGAELPISSIAVGDKSHAGNLVTVRDIPLSLVAAVSRQETRIEGYARRDGKGVAGVMVVLIPKDLSAIRGFVRRDQSDSDGSFALRDVAPGQYTAVAIQDGWELDWAQPEVIARYLPGGISVTVTDTSGKLIRLSEPVPVQTR
jgi:hypothetical protein